jgi:hypothetical protein
MAGIIVMVTMEGQASDGRTMAGVGDLRLHSGVMADSMEVADFMVDSMVDSMEAAMVADIRINRSPALGRAFSLVRN